MLSLQGALSDPQERSCIVRWIGSWPRAFPLCFTLLIPGAAFCRPLGQSQSLSKIESLNLSGPASDFLPHSSPRAFHVATAGTTFFGGTVWAADSMRWEALE